MYSYSTHLDDLWQPALAGVSSARLEFGRLVTPAVWVGAACSMHLNACTLQSNTTSSQQAALVCTAEEHGQLAQLHATAEPAKAANKHMHSCGIRRL